jgi:hypothetical protein
VRGQGELPVFTVQRGKGMRLSGSQADLLSKHLLHEQFRRPLRLSKFIDPAPPVLELRSPHL